MLIRIWCTLKISRISRPSTPLAAITIQAPLHGGSTELGRQCSYLKQNMQAKPREEGDVGMWVLDLGLGLGHTETAAAATPPNHHSHLLRRQCSTYALH